MLKAKRVLLLGSVAVILAIFTACASETTGSSSEPAKSSSATSESASSELDTSTDVAPIPEFDVAAFAAINPDPDIRILDHLADLQSEFAYYERDRIARDAISPVYTPKFVSPQESPLRQEELVMGVEINGDARAYPVGMMRIREMVNDEVGGTPVLVTW